MRDNGGSSYEILEVARIGKYGKMILPKEIQDRLGVKKGDKVIFVLDNRNRICLMSPREMKVSESKVEFIPVG